ncbi:MAG: 5'-nucleotidase C-terminal domain-containing protein, partial [Burkholderiales bacterium]
RLGRDMARVGGLSFGLDPAKPAGERIFGLTLLRNNQPLDAGRSYTVAGWAGSEPAEGPPIWDVVSGHIERRKTIRAQERKRVRLAG